MMKKEYPSDKKTGKLVWQLTLFIFSLCIFVQGVSPSFAASSPLKSNEEIFLWSSAAPGSEGLNLSEGT